MANCFLDKFKVSVVTFIVLPIDLDVYSLVIKSGEDVLIFRCFSLCQHPEKAFHEEISLGRYAQPTFCQVSGGG